MTTFSHQEMEELEEKVKHFLQKTKEYKRHDFDSEDQNDKIKQEADDILVMFERLQENLMKQKQYSEALEKDNQSLQKELEQQNVQLKEVEEWLQEDVTFYLQPILQNIVDKFIKKMEEQNKNFNNQIEHQHKENMESLRDLNTRIDKLISNESHNKERDNEVLNSIKELHSKIGYKGDKPEHKKEQTSDKTRIPIQIKDEDQWFYNSLTTPKQVKDMMARQTPYNPKKTSNRKKSSVSRYNSTQLSENEPINKEKQQEKSEPSPSSKQNQLKYEEITETPNSDPIEQKSPYQDSNNNNKEKSHSDTSSSEVNQSTEPTNGLLSFLKKFSQ